MSAELLLPAVRSAFAVPPRIVTAGDAAVDGAAKNAAAAMSPNIDLEVLSLARGGVMSLFEAACACA